MRTRLARIVVGGFLGLSLLFGATRFADRSTPAATAAQSWYDVWIEDNYYDPSEIWVTAGDTVYWTNNGVAIHTATGDIFDTGVLYPGEWAGFTFNEPGEYWYYCLVHPRQYGVVIVE